MAKERVLVVDDELNVRNFCSRILRRLEYQVHTASSGEEALTLLREGHFELLITDLTMEGLSGVELITQARQIVADLAIVVITGYGTLEHAIKALRAGAHDFLTKPFSGADLRDAVSHALGQAEMQRERARLRVLLPLAELGRRSLQGVELESIGQQILEIATGQTEADGALLFVQDEEGRVVLRKMLGRFALQPQLAEAVLQLDFHEDTFLISRNDASLPEVAEAMRAYGAGALLCAPLQVPSRTVGELVLSRAHTDRMFGPADLELASVLAAHSAALLENARLMARMEEWNRELEVAVRERTQELERAQEQLLRTERLATVGELGAGIAHELRNPLGVINNSIYYLRLRLRDADDKVQKHLAIIEREVQAANDIITGLMSFVRVAEINPVPISPNDLVIQTLERATLPDNVRVVTRLEEDVAQVMLDVGKMEQVFLNLINNAVQAMPEGGELCISTECRDGRVFFHFSDQGGGIAPELQQRIFEPLFTTKAKGIGLGLSIVRILVEAHRGEIQVQSEPGKGATFTVSLPYDQEQE